jgi:uncharacterized membrane protein YfcA
MSAVFDAVAPLTWVLIALSAFVVGTLHTASGLAGGVVLSIILTPLIGVEKVIPVLSVALLIGATTRLWIMRHSVNWKIYRAVMVTGIPAIASGSVIYSLMSPQMMSGLLGAFVLATTVARRLLKDQRFVIGMRGFSVIGVLFGVVSGATVGGGMVLTPFFLGAGLMGVNYVAMIGAVGFTLNAIKALTFASLSLLGPEIITIGVVIGLFLVPGTYLGFWIVSRTPVRIHTGIVEAIIVTGALYFLWSAFSSI